MKLLFDQNLSYRLADQLADLFPESQHVRTVGLAAADDDEVWYYAEKHGLTVVSKDSDFHQRSFVLGQPPKIIWIRRGNCSTQDVHDVLRGRYSEIVNFDNDADASFLALD
ncbi:MAG: DUF5615 family PIN-like protein [Planctomycetota bacterium]|nr:DUF5615 family PIN-like protein [Planctomycetota bacterium]MDA1141392.1 DUF5615 family PIN-like protein [Planctomycetota bacterium]